MIPGLGIPKIYQSIVAAIQDVLKLTIGSAILRELEECMGNGGVGVITAVPKQDSKSLQQLMGRFLLPPILKMLVN
jgi:hypothetical protein